MGRPKRPDEAGSIYHAINRGNARDAIFRKPERLHAHYQTAGEGHVYQGRFKSFPIQDDEHFLAVCRYVERNALRAGLVERAEEWKWGSLSRWLATPEPEPKLLSQWPIPRSPQWDERVNAALSEKEMQTIRGA